MRAMAWGMLLLLPASAAEGWPLWESYAQMFLDAQGRIVEHDEKSKTTSEAQAYALFFALVANDQPRFDKLLQWTRDNLAQGDLGARLPSWLWGQAENGKWGVLDPNPASDADLWIAYTLLEAGRAWSRPELSALGERVAAMIAEREVVELPKFGPMLLPGPIGFRPDAETFILNPSYLPIPVLTGLGRHLPGGPWNAIAQRVPQLVASTSPRGLALDWVTYSSRGGFRPKGREGEDGRGSYDAIRVYLWAGLMDPESAGRRELLAALPGMARILERSVLPPSEVSSDGKVLNRQAGVGFSAALIPYCLAAGHPPLANEQRSRLAAHRNPATGLYGQPPKYYDQNLALFAVGFSELRFRFDAAGSLILRWRQNRE